MFDEANDFGDALFGVQMTEGEPTIQFGSIDYNMCEISVETHFGKDSADGRPLNAFALFESEVRRDKSVDQAGEPDVPEGGVGFDAGKKGVLDGIGPCSTLIKHSVVLCRV